MRHGSHLDPPNRFQAVQQSWDDDYLESDPEYARALVNRSIEYVFDESQTVVAENPSPDIPFRYSVNPYRGCIHGCAYCYARPSHEYLGFNAGLDFETKIVVKRDAPRLLRQFLGQPRWQPEPITFSGVTDCYQPAEREFQLTRQCLEVARDCGQPVSVITKNALVLRDLELLQAMAREHLVHVMISVTTLDPELAGTMEPRTSRPAARLRAMAALAEAGIPVGIITAPLIPGLNESEVPQLLAAAAQAGAQSASYTLLRLPLTVEPVFIEWLERTQPLKAAKVLSRVRQVRAGQLNRSDWGERMTGTGPLAEQIRQLFDVFRRRWQLDRPLTPFNVAAFRPPRPESGQLRLF